MSHNVSPSKTCFHMKFIVKTVYTSSFKLYAGSAIVDVTLQVHCPQLSQKKETSLSFKLKTYFRSYYSLVTPFFWEDNVVINFLMSKLSKKQLLLKSIPMSFLTKIVHLAILLYSYLWNQIISFISVP